MHHANDSNRYSQEVLAALREYLYRLRWADVLARNAEYAVFFPYHERLLVRSRVAGRFQPFIDVHWAGFYAGAVGHADVKVYADVGAPYSELARGVVGTPDGYALELADLLPLFLELDVDWAFHFGVAGASA